MTVEPGMEAERRAALRGNVVYYTGALVLAVLAINLLLAALEMLFHNSGGGGWSALVANYAASSAAGLRYANRNGPLTLETRKRLALAYLAVQLVASLLLSAGFFLMMGADTFAALAQGLPPAVLAGVALAAFLLGGLLSYAVSRFALAQAAKIHDRNVARKAGANR